MLFIEWQKTALKEFVIGNNKAKDDIMQIRFIRNSILKISLLTILKTGCEGYIDRHGVEVVLIVRML